MSVSSHVRVQIRDLVQDLHEVLLAERIVVRPGNLLAGVGGLRPVPETHEREAPVVLRVGLDRHVAAQAAAAEPALRERDRAAQDEEREGGGHLHGLASRSRIAFVLSARFVSSRSIS